MKDHSEYIWGIILFLVILSYTDMVGARMSENAMMKKLPLMIKIKWKKNYNKDKKYRSMLIKERRKRNKGKNNFIAKKKISITWGGVFLQILWKWKNLIQSMKGFPLEIKKEKKLESNRILGSTRCTKQTIAWLD